MDKYYVYALIDPINMIPFYIGKGCDKRAWVHLGDKDNCNQKKHSYIKAIRDFGLEPIVMFIQESLTSSAAYSLENTCIRIGKKLFPWLTNTTGVRNPPSRKGVKLSAETIAKRNKTISEKKLNGTWHKEGPSVSVRKHLSVINKGKTLSNNTKQKISDGLKTFYKNGKLEAANK